MAISIDAGDVAKIATAFGSLGGGFAFVKTFAERLFTFWLERARASAEIADAKERAVERIAVSNERMVGVLEAFDRRFERVDVRLDRIEAHHGISPSPSAVPPEEPSAHPRRRLTDPDLDQQARAVAPLSARSRPAAEPG